MSKKRKCKLCENSMGWALPEKVTSDNYEYAKYCLCVAKTTILCGHTMKTKGIEHEQYCKYFYPKSDSMIKLDEFDERKIQEFEDMIKEYEKRARGEKCVAVKRKESIDD